MIFFFEKFTQIIRTKFRVNELNLVCRLTKLHGSLHMENSDFVILGNNIGRLVPYQGTVPIASKFLTATSTRTRFKYVDYLKK